MAISGGGGGGTSGGGTFGGGSNTATSRVVGVDYTAQVYGRPIPLSSGRRGITGVPIWSAPIESYMVTLYEYGDTGLVDHQWVGQARARRDFAIAFGRNLAPEDERGTLGLLRLWANDKKIYDATDPTSSRPGLQFQLYSGSSTQPQDPLMLLDRGDVVPAYHNLIYIVFSKYDLDMITDPLPGPGPYLAVPGHADGKIPSIRAEFVDGLVISNDTDDFTALDTNTITGETLFVDWEEGYLYGFSGVGTAAASVHKYDLEAKVEVGANVIASDDITYTNLNGISLGVPMFDRVNKIMIAQRNGVGNTAGVVSVNVDTGALIDIFGDESSSTEPTDASDNNSDTSGEPIANLPWFGASDIVYVGNGAGTQPVACVSSSVTDFFTVLPMSTAGLFPTDIPKAGTAFDEDTSEGGIASFQFTEDDIHCIRGLPLYEFSKSIMQDGAAVVGCGQYLYLMLFGFRDDNCKLFGRYLIKDFGAGYDVHNVIIDPRDNGIVVFCTDGSTNWFVSKYRCLFSQIPLGPAAAELNDWDWHGTFPAVNYATGSGIVPSTAPPYELVAIPSMNTGINYELAGGQSQMSLGTFGYPTSSGGGDVILLDLSNGTTTTIDNSLSFDAFQWDSRARRLFFRKTGTQNPAVTNINAAIGDSVMIGTVLRWMAMALGYDEADIDVDPQLLTDTPDNEVLGTFLDHPYSVPLLFGSLGKMYDFRYFESEGKIKFTRAARGESAEEPVFELSIDDLAYVSENGLTPNDALITVISEPKEQLAGVSVQYVDFDQNYSLQTQTYNLDTQTSDLVGVQVDKLDIPIVMTTSEAYRRASKISIRSVGDSDLHDFRLPQKYSRLEPNDIVRVVVPPFSYDILIDEVTFNGDWSISLAGASFASTDDVTIPDQDDLGDYDDFGFGLGDSKPLVLDVPLLAINDNPGSLTFLLYVGVTSFGQLNFSNANIVSGPSPSGPFQPLFNFDEVQPDGSTVGTLADTSTPFTTDDTTTLRIALKGSTSDDWDSTDAAGLLDGSNAMLIGANGRWELVFFRDVTVLNPKVVEVSGLLRGRRGTDVNVGTHQPGDQVVLVRSVAANFTSHLKTQPWGESDVGDVWRYSAEGQPQSRPIQVVDVTLAGATAKPWAPAQVEATLEVGDDVQLTWLRRDRLGTEFVTDPQPLSEEAELYDLEILDGSDIVRTVSGLTSPDYLYDAADQATDGFAVPMSSITVRVYQVSGLVGRGFPREVTVDVL